MVHNSTRSFIGSADEGSDSVVAARPSTGLNSEHSLQGEKKLLSIATVIRALDSPIRIQIVLALYERPHYVHELVDLVKHSQPLVSQHLKVLKSAGLVDAQRSGRQMVYSMIEPLVMDILALAHDAGASQPE